MFVVCISHDDVDRLLDGVPVTINGKPETICANDRGELCWRDQRRTIVDVGETSEGYLFICGDQDGGAIDVIQPCIGGAE